MRFLIEYEGAAEADTGYVGIADSLGEVHRVAGELIAEDPGPEGALGGLSARTEGELAGPWGVLRFAPAG